MSWSRFVAPARLAPANLRRACAAAIALAVTTVAAGTLRAGESSASTATELAAIRARIADGEARAQELTEDYELALKRAGELELAIADTAARIAKLDRRATRLGLLVQDRAVIAYMNGDATSTVGARLLDDEDAILTSGREQQFAAAATQRDLALLDDYSAAAGDLAEQRESLQEAKEEQDDAVATIASSSDDLSAELEELKGLQAELEEQLRAEEEARRRAEEAARRARAEAAARERAARERAATSTTAATPATASTSTTRSSGGSGTTPTTSATTPATTPTTAPTTTTVPTTSPPPPPTTTTTTSGGGGGGILGVAVCPINGPLSFIDSWHYPRPGGRLHEGVDLMSPGGTPNVAVTSGTITQGYGSTQGNGVHLNGDNGHVYYYFHLSSYAGGPRRVSVGEVIGYTGNTGNASGGPTHTHFEIHPYGGAAVNPYPAAAAAC